MEEFHYKKFSGLNDDVVSLRTTVFMQEQGFKNEFDETDKTCVHVVLYDGDKPIATCRYFHEGTIDHIGRVAVLKAYRGQNLGHNMMQRAEAEIKKDGGHSIELSAQLRVKDFYKKLGYQEEGNVYLDEYCEHITMVKTI